MSEVISQQQSSFGIGDMDGYDQEQVLVQSGGVVIVKSHHGRLRERIDGGATCYLNFFRARTGYRLCWSTESCLAHIFSVPRGGIENIFACRRGSLKLLARPHPLTTNSNVKKRSVVPRLYVAAYGT
eukprot:scaffold151486_cov57-Attheya_sp.AAC.4